MTGETAKALFITVDGEKKVVPKSQVHDDSEVWQTGDKGTMIMAKWLADKEELEGETYEEKE